MHHHEAAVGHDQRARGEPRDECIPVRRGEDRVECVAAVGLAMAGRDGEQVEVVVAEHAHGGVAQRHHLAQHRERSGAAIDEVADEPQPVLARREADQVEELAELGVAALDVADGVMGHVNGAGSAASKPATDRRSGF